VARKSNVRGILQFVANSSSGVVMGLPPATSQLSDSINLRFICVNLVDVEVPAVASALR